MWSPWFTVYINNDIINNDIKYRKLGDINMKKRHLIPVLALLFSVGLSINSKSVETKAATPMPTKIIFDNLTDSEVSSYYAGVEGKSGDDLLGFLYTKIKDHNEYDYENNTHRLIYKIIDRDWDLDALAPEGPANLENFDYNADNGYIKKLYAPYNGDLATADRFKNDGDTRVSFDKEHIWPQSLGEFGRTGGAGSDFHSLWPSDVKGNQQGHSNYGFGVPQTEITDVPGDKGTSVGRNGYVDGSPNKVFEPLDEFKGDVARAMFYMPARYYEYIDVLHPKLELVDESLGSHTASTSVTGKGGILTTLLEWNELDPVDEHEIKRNNLIANNYQMNRNPFIDYPQWARIAYDPTFSDVGASNALESSSVGTNSSLVEDAQILSISLNTSRAKVKFEVGEKFSTQGLVVTGTYDNGVRQRVGSFNTDITTDTVLNGVGTKLVKVSVTHKEKTVEGTYQIEVVAKAPTLLDMLTPTTMIIIGVVALFLIIIIIIILSNPKARKRAKKEIKKAVKKEVKSQTKKRSTSSKKK